MQNQRLLDVRAIILDIFDFCNILVEIKNNYAITILFYELIFLNIMFNL